MTVLDIVEYAVGGIAHISCYADTTALALKGVSKRIFRIVRDAERSDRYIPYHKSVFIKFYSFIQLRIIKNCINSIKIINKINIKINT